MLKNAAIIFMLLFAVLSYADSARENIVISSFSTSVAHQSSEVKHNIALACGKLNGIRIAAGTVFSFNETVGEASAKNGYADGAVLYQDSIVMEAGGGLCQVSSTLFNALLLAGCAIAERHRHYQPVTYVPLGLDATIKYGKKDLRMKNSTGQDLLISVRVSDSSCTMIIYGTVKPSRSYSLDTEDEEINIPFSEHKGNIRNGIEVYVYRSEIKDDVVIGRFLLYKDFYPPVYVK
ncbi:MAG: VanW family protein [Leptospirales bacterium]|nr:VanW family protein [Leptospirales bacterium]